MKYSEDWKKLENLPNYKRLINVCQILGITENTIAPAPFKKYFEWSIEGHNLKIYFENQDDLETYVFEYGRAKPSSFTSIWAPIDRVANMKKEIAPFLKAVKNS